MQEKKRPEKIKPLPELEKSVTEILVANGRSFEPFVKTFSYSGENVTKASLGTLVGVFEVDERSEDSAYIVNFLASVAKKEYFGNPRRGAVESFEAALHKINLALAELVKHGNIAWLGKFHGALGVFEKNSLHFSVTGGAKILLFRNDTLSDIGDGLASEESSIHPIKTFVEVSSGRLMLADKVILSSPELFDLFSMEDLRKNALRMDDERFGQFLKTALRNELDMAGAIVADLRESIPIIQKAPERKLSEAETPRILGNVFSQAAFSRSKKRGPAEQAPAETEEPAQNEYVDSKTGHIYIQGDTPEEPSAHPLLERLSFTAQEAGASFASLLVSQGKWLRKMKKQSSIALDVIAREAVVAGRKTVRALRKQWRKGLSELQAKKDASLATLREARERRTAERSASQEMRPPVAPKPTIVTDIPAKEVLREISKETAEETENETPEEIPQAPVQQTEEKDAREEEADIPPFMREKLAAFYRKEYRETPGNAEEKIISAAATIGAKTEIPRLFAEKTAPAFDAARCAARAGLDKTIELCKLSIESVRILLRSTALFYRNLAPLHKKIVLGGTAAAILIASLALFFFSRGTGPESAPVAQEAPAENAPAFLIENEKNARLAETPAILTASEDRPIVPVILDNDIFLVSSRNITNIRENKTYPLPAGSSPVAFAAAMDDLRLIFVSTETGELFAWSPISRTFAKNTLALPEGADVQAIGTYLTYLYVLDSATDQVYRFPRAEGGFGQPSVWLKDTVAFEENAKMAVNETIFIAPDRSTVQAFFRGRLVENLESPTTPLSLTSLYTHPGLANVYALDKENKRILVWREDGPLIAQYFSEKLVDGQAITVNERTGEALVTTQNSLLSFKLESIQ